MSGSATQVCDRMGDRQTFLGTFGRFIRRNEPLAGFTTFGIGGPAEMLAEVESIENLVAILNGARTFGIPTTVLGEGSNLLIGDGGIEGLVVVNRCRCLQKRGTRVIAEAGARLNGLVDFAIDNGLAGLEKMAGIPGTVGGAVIGNAGAYGRSISAVLVGVKLMLESGQVVDRKCEELGFAYRTSRLKGSTDVVLAAEFELAPGSPSEIRRSADEVLARRRMKLPAGDVCAGSYFKNIEDPSAPDRKTPVGKLLEEAGVKSLRAGGAAVSEKHANVIVNSGGATAADVLELAEKMKRAVREKFGVELEEEVCFLGKQLQVDGVG